MPSEVRFAEIRKLLEHHGWTLARINGSHHIFTGVGRPPISIPVHGGSGGRVKPHYIREVHAAIKALGQGNGHAGRRTE